MVLHAPSAAIQPPQRGTTRRMEEAPRWGRFCSDLATCALRGTTDDRVEAFIQETPGALWAGAVRSEWLLTGSCTTIVRVDAREAHARADRLPSNGVSPAEMAITVAIFVQLNGLIIKIDHVLFNVHPVAPIQMALSRKDTGLVIQ